MSGGPRLAGVFGAAALLGGCAPPAPAPRASHEPQVSVGLTTGAVRVVIAGQGTLAATNSGEPVATLRVGEQASMTADGHAVVMAVGGVTSRRERLTFVSLGAGQFVTVDAKPYRGVVEVVARPGGVTVINRLQLEDYLQGVVSAEMGRRGSNETAALQAQAVVSRTYALRNRGRFASDGYDISATVADQAYGGITAETPEGTAAVRSTRGVVLTYQGVLAKVLFHSTCGYSTAAPSEVFHTIQDTPYLRPVSDRRPGGGYYCDISPRFRWRVEWDQATLRDILRRTVPNVLGISADRIGTIRDLRVRATGRSGRATDVRIAVGEGEISVTGPDLRAVLLTPEGRPLGSTAVQLHPEREGDSLVRLVAAGAGWGHGVGMCQWGAVGRARAGQTYRDIVSAYFPGSQLERWY